MDRMIDRATLARAVEGNDAALWKSFYSEDAEVAIIDQDHPPSQPLLVKGSAAIGAMFDDVCGRALTHRLDDAVLSDDRLAFSETCTYPDGIRVRMAAMAELENGRIRRQVNIQAWDH